MLERASECLTSGAPRQSLRCITRVARSKRMLPSTFWNHGAGDLDLDLVAWSAPRVTTPSDLPLQGGDTKHARGGVKRRSWQASQAQLSAVAPSRSAGEGLFLDFLYPPQALAWLQRVQSQSTAAWDRRNLWRHPDGFVLASRAYTSRSYEDEVSNGSRANEPVADDYEQLGSRDSEVDDGGANYGNNLDETLDRVEPTREPPYTEEAENVDYVRFQPLEHAGVLEHREDNYASLPGQDSVAGYAFAEAVREKTRRRGNAEDQQQFAQAVQHEQSDTTLRQSDDVVRTEESEYSSDLGLVDSPAELADSLDGPQRLRNLLMFGRGGSRFEEHTTRALKIYDELDERSKSDSKLKRELAGWLSKQYNAAAESKCVELYYELLPGQKTLELYESVLALFLRRKQLDLAWKLSKEALRTIENGDKISRQLFTYAIQEELWQLAMHTADHLHTAFSATDQDSRMRVFWLHVSDTPQLLTKAFQLAAFLRASERKHSVDKPLGSFCARFFKEAIAQELFRPDGSTTILDYKPATLHRNSLRYIFKHVAETGFEDPRFFRDSLYALLKLPSSNYADVHHIVSSVYTLYIAMPNAQPPESLIQLWLRRLSYYTGRSAKVASAKNSMTIRELTAEWIRFHGRVRLDSVKELLGLYASTGMVEDFDHWLQYLRSTYPRYEDQKDIMFNMVYMHARRKDLDTAQQAFAEIQRFAAEHNDVLDIKCWGALLHAHERVDDLHGALTNLQNLLDSPNLQPNQYCFHSVLLMLARRGDVDGTQNMIEQSESLTGKERNFAHIFALMTAHVHNDDVDEAEAVLRDALLRSRSGHLEGSLSRCFDVVLAARAALRDIDGTKRIYAWMKAEDVKLTPESYGALMQALTHYRQTDAAWNILKNVMPANDVKPTAFHYALVIYGYVSEMDFEEALRAHDRMLGANIKPNFSTNAAYLQAKAMKERHEFQKLHPRNARKSWPAPVEQTTKLLDDYLKQDTALDVVSKGPLPGLGAYFEPDADTARFFDILIRMHGRDTCFQAAKVLQERYAQDMLARGVVQYALPIKLLGAFAAAHFRARDYEEVERFWHLAKDQADQLAPAIPVPTLQRAKRSGRTRVAAADALDLRPSEEDTGIRESDSYTEAAPTTSHSATTPATKYSVPESEPAFDRVRTGQPRQDLLTDKADPTPSMPAPARRHVLTPVFRWYLKSLALQRRMPDAIATFTALLKQGYTLDNTTFNELIEALCRTSPPIALLAFSLVEKFMIPQFPGWAMAALKWRPKPQERREGLEHIKARYLGPRKLIPQYRTLVWLGAALLQIRRMEALGRRGVKHDLQPELERYVGTLRQIRERAPTTLHAVQSMPRVADDLQNCVLRPEP